MHVKFDEKGSNAGGSGAFVAYLGKEDELNQQREGKAEEWFSHARDECHPVEVRASIDSDHQGIGKDAARFTTGSISLTEHEWNALGSTEGERHENLKAWIQEDFSQEFAGNYDKHKNNGEAIPIEPDNMKMYYKIEHDRYYTGRDEEVKQGEKQQGEAKEGFNLHCHFILATKTEDGKNRINPSVNSRKEFDRNSLFEKAEKSFDQRAGYDRPLQESYEYYKTMKNGTGEEKVAMIERAAADELKRDRTPQPEQHRTQEREQQQRRDNDMSIGM
jgi:hypothetical protein